MHVRDYSAALKAQTSLAFCCAGRAKPPLLARAILRIGSTMGTMAQRLQCNYQTAGPINSKYTFGSIAVGPSGICATSASCCSCAKTCIWTYQEQRGWYSYRTGKPGQSEVECQRQVVGCQRKNHDSKFAQERLARTTARRLLQGPCQRFVVCCVRSSGRTASVCSGRAVWPILNCAQPLHARRSQIKQPDAPL